MHKKQLCTLSHINCTRVSLNQYWDPSVPKMFRGDWVHPTLQLLLNKWAFSVVFWCLCSPHAGQKGLLMKLHYSHNTSANSWKTEDELMKKKVTRMENNTDPYNFKGQRNMEHHAQAKLVFPMQKIPKLKRSAGIFLFSSLQLHLCHIFAVLQSSNCYAIYLIFMLWSQSTTARVILNFGLYTNENIISIKPLLKVFSLNVPTKNTSEKN